MNEIQISTYRAPRWGSRATGIASIRKDNQARYYVDNVAVSDTRIVDLYTVVTCIDGTTHNVLTVFFRQVDRAVKTELAVPDMH
jgi:hypothetical protein